MSRTIDFQDHLNEKLADPTFARGYVIALDAEIAQLREENARLKSAKVAYSSCDCDTKAMHQMHIFLQEAARARDRYRAALERIAADRKCYCDDCPCGDIAREALTIINSNPDSVDYNNLRKECGE